MLLKVNGRAESRRPVWQSEEEQVPGLLLLSCVRGWGSNLLGWSGVRVCRMGSQKTSGGGNGRKAEFH